jgi:hypothetical protein
VTQTPPSAAAGGYPPGTERDAMYLPQFQAGGAIPGSSADTDDDAARGHRSSRRRGPLRRLLRGREQPAVPPSDAGRPLAPASRGLSRPDAPPAGQLEYRPQHRAPLPSQANYLRQPQPAFPDAEAPYQPVTEPDSDQAARDHLSAFMPDDDTGAPWQTAAIPSPQGPAAVPPRPAPPPDAAVTGGGIPAVAAHGAVIPAAHAPAPERPGVPAGDTEDTDPLYRVLAGLAMRDLTLVESLLQVVEKLESHEEDPQQLELLFRIDHLATRMRRNSENLLVLAGHDSEGRDFEPVPLLDVARAAISEITDYSRAQATSLPDVRVIGLVADDLSHILAELLDNATSKSPESAAVVVHGERTGDGTMLLSVEDAGIGIPADRLAEINARLGRPPVLDTAATRHMGLYVVGRLAHRHGIRVQLRERPYGGITAHVIIPSQLILAPPGAPPHQPARHNHMPRPQPGHPAAAPAAGPGPAPALPAAPRFQPADPAALPRRMPGKPAAAGGMPVPGQAARPTPPVPAAGEPSESRADRIRDELAGFQLGQRAARAGEPAPEGPEPPTMPRLGPASQPPRIPVRPPADGPARPNGLPTRQPREHTARPNGDRPARPGEEGLRRIGDAGGGGTEADET